MSEARTVEVDPRDFWRVERDLENARERLREQKNSAEELIDHNSRIKALEDSESGRKVSPYHVLAGLVIVITGAWGAMTTVVSPTANSLDDLERLFEAHAGLEGHPRAHQQLIDITRRVESFESAGYATSSDLAELNARLIEALVAYEGVDLDHVDALDSRLTGQLDAVRAALSLVSADIGTTLEKHTDSLTGHEAVVSLVEKVSRLRTELDGAATELGLLKAALKETEGLTDRAHAFLEESKRRILVAEERSTSNERAISSMAGTVGASFVEVESQLRGVVANIVLMDSFQNALLGMLGVKVEIPLDLDMVRRELGNIPASAFTELGNVKTNGGH